MSKFPENLVSPLQRETLVYDAAQAILRAEGTTYPIRQGVPVLLPRQTTEKVQAHQHEKLGTHFSYTKHYIKDAELFDYFKEEEDAATRHENRRLHEYILSRLPAQYERVLDVGCGKAWVAHQLLPEGKTIISFDISLVNTTKALECYPAPNHYAVMGDVYYLPFESDSMDVIISAEVMEHVPDVLRYLKSLVRVVKPGGRILISTPYNEHIIESLCIHCNRPTPQHAHLHSFTEGKIDRLMEKIPGVSHQMYTLSNKVLLFARTHPLLRHVPFSIWKGIDKMANALIRKPARLIIEINKTRASE